MKFFLNIIHKTALFAAVESGNINVIKLLLTIPEIDANIICIFIFNFCNKVQKFVIFIAF